MVHLRGTIEQEAKAFGRSVACSDKARIPLIDIVVLRLTVSDSSREVSACSVAHFMAAFWLPRGNWVMCLACVGVSIPSRKASRASSVNRSIKAERPEDV